jgi:predicted nucleotidyltransferase
MIEIVEKNISEISEACSQYNVALLQLFGSAAREIDFTDKSDLDFLVSFHPFTEGDPNKNCIRKVENLKRLQEKLESITQRKVDMIEENSIRNKYLRYFINKDKVLIYGIPQHSSLA